MLRQSPPLDQPGVFARSLDDAALMAEVMMGFDAADTYTRPQATPRLLQSARQEPPMPPKLAFMQTPAWDQAEEGTKAAFNELTEFLEDRVDTVELAEVYNEIFDWQQTIIEADLAKNFARDYVRAADQFSSQLTEMIERGRKVSAVDYNIGLERMVEFERGLDDALNKYDAILTPATPGEAPVGLESTGSPAFCTLWTFTGLPAVTLPLMNGEAGMPLGVQLIGKKGGDAQLLRTAQWLTQQVQNDDSE